MNNFKQNQNSKRNPYEDAFLNRFGQWMVLKKRKKVFFGLVFTAMTLAMMPLSPHIQMGFIFYVFGWVLVALVIFIYKIIYNSQVQQYIDFENGQYFK